MQSGSEGSHPHADRAAEALIGPDWAGVPAGNATRLGVMYIGWNGKFWAAYSPERGWTQLNGCPKSNDTTCHRNHMHISLTRDGTALAPLCSSARTDAVVLDAGRADAAVRWLAGIRRQVRSSRLHPMAPSHFPTPPEALIWS